VTGVTTPTAATPTGESNPMVVQMLQQYSDMMLSMIQQRMATSGSQSPR